MTKTYRRAPVNTMNKDGLSKLWYTKSILSLIAIHARAVAI